MKRERFVWLGAVAAATGSLFSTAPRADAAAVTPGNLVVYRVGEGAVALNGNATSAFLDEYTVTGTLVQSIAIPNAGATALTNIGTGTTEGILTPSQNGSQLLFGGYRHDATALSAPASTDARVIGTLDATGAVNTSIATTGFGSGNIRSATTNGSVYYIGASSGVFYVGTPSGSSTATSVDTRNSRQVFLANGNLYASNGSTTIVNKIQFYGQTPTTTTTPTPVAVTAIGDAVNGFYMADLSPTVAGVDTAYGLDTVAGRLLKYTFDGTAWTANGAGVLTSAANLVAIASGGNVNLYLTTGTTLVSLADTSGYNGTLAGTFTTLATATANEGFRGVGTLPAADNSAIVVVAPEPTVGLAGAGMVGLLGLARRRRRATAA